MSCFGDKVTPPQKSPTQFARANQLSSQVWNLKTKNIAQQKKQKKNMFGGLI